MNITELIRPDVASMEAYAPIVPFEVLSARLGRAPEAIVKLDANENPYGPSPRVREALGALPFPHIYPDPESTLLRAALARDTGVPAENLLAGAGADELIDLIMRLFLQPEDAVIDCPPTFGMYPFDAAVNSARVVRIPRRPDFSVDVEGVLEVFQTPALPDPADAGPDTPRPAPPLTRTPAELRGGRSPSNRPPDSHGGGAGDCAGGRPRTISPSKIGCGCWIAPREASQTPFRNVTQQSRWVGDFR